MANISLELAHNLTEAGLYLKDVHKADLTKAVRSALNRSLKSLETESNKAIRRIRRLKAREIRREWFVMVKRTKGRNIAAFEAILGIKDKPVSLIRFVKGSKNPRNQQGVKVARRRKIAIEIKPGNKKKLKDAFIAKGRGNKNHVFRRETSKSFPINKQSTPSLHLLFKDSAFRRPIENIVAKRLQREFVTALNFAISKRLAKDAVSSVYIKQGKGK